MSTIKPKESFSAQKKFVAAIIAALALALAIYVLASCQYMPGFLQHHDNIVEEMVESVIEQHTGVDIDITPDTPE